MYGTGKNFKRKQDAVKQLMNKGFKNEDIQKTMSNPTVIEALELGKNIEDILSEGKI